jgi:hypothetical protein
VAAWCIFIKTALRSKRAWYQPSCKKVTLTHPSRGKSVVRRALHLASRAFSNSYEEPRRAMRLPYNVSQNDDKTPAAALFR